MKTEFEKRLLTSLVLIFFSTFLIIKGSFFFIFFLGIILLIRTGNTKRLSNFLLWQLAYAEIFFEKKLWPDFNEKDYNKVIKKFKKIKRNFGKI